MKLRSLFRLNLRQWTDEALAEAYRERGDDRFFNELFDRYYLIVYGWCLRMLPDRAESKDQTMIIFHKAHEALQYSTVGNVELWLARLSKNQCIDHLRHAGREAEKAEMWMNWEKSEEKFVENEAFLRLISEGEPEKEAWMLEEMEQLPPEQRRCLELFYWRKKPYREIAELTGLSDAEVKSHLQNGKRKLAVRLAKRLNSDEHET